MSEIRPAAACGLAGSLVMVLVLAGVAPAQTAQNYGDIKVIVYDPMRGVASHGYQEINFVVHNTSKEQTHRVTLTAPHDTSGIGDVSHIRSLSRTVEVGPLSKVRVSLYQPAVPGIYGGGVTVEINGDVQKARVDVTFPHGGEGMHMHRHRGPGVGDGTSQLILIGPDLSADDHFQNAVRLLRGKDLEPFRGVDRLWDGPPGGGMGGPMGGPPGGPPGGGIPGPPPPDPPPGGGGAPRPVIPGGPGEAAQPPPPGGEPPIVIDHGPQHRMFDEFDPLLHSFNFDKWQRGNPPWSSNWLAYSRYDGIVLTARELDKIEPAERAALWQYVEAGGSLLVVGPAKVCEGWKPERDGKNRFTAYRPAFGVCFVADDPEFNGWFDGWRDELWVQITDSWKRTAAPWQHSMTVMQANERMPVVEDIGIPVRGLFVLMVVFAVVLGPINLGLLNRWKKRIWLLWTVPVVSLITCFLVFGYMMVAEGWSGHMRTDSVTILDESVRTQAADGLHATTLGWTGFYSPVTVSDGLHFGSTTELTLQHGDDLEEFHRGRRGGGGDSGRPCSIDWTSEQHFSRGWVSARIPAHFRLRKCEVRRERVEVRKEADGQYRIVNMLGADITQFWYADDEGRLHTASSVAAGSEVALKRTNDTLEPAEQRKPWREIYVSNWMDLGKTLSARPGAYLPPGTYLAVVDGTPFVEEALRDAKTRKLSSVVLGIPKKP